MSANSGVASESRATRSEGIFRSLRRIKNRNAPDLSACSGVRGDISRTGPDATLLVVLFHRLVPGSLANFVGSN